MKVRWIVHLVPLNQTRTWQELEDASVFISEKQRIPSDQRSTRKLSTKQKVSRVRHNR